MTRVLGLPPIAVIHQAFDIKVYQKRSPPCVAQESVRDLRLPEASVETIAEFIDAFLEPMRPNSTVIRPEQETLQVGDHNGHPGQPYICPLGRGDLGDVRDLDR